MEEERRVYIQAETRPRCGKTCLLKSIATISEDFLNDEEKKSVAHLKKSVSFWDSGSERGCCASSVRQIEREGEEKVEKEEEKEEKEKLQQEECEGEKLKEDVILKNNTDRSNLQELFMEGFLDNHNFSYFETMGMQRMFDDSSVFRRIGEFSISDFDAMTEKKKEEEEEEKID